MSSPKLSPSFTAPLAILGTFTISYLIKQVSGFIRVNSLQRSKLVSRYLRSHTPPPDPTPSITVASKSRSDTTTSTTASREVLKRSWALVTGVSDGIGKWFVQELCSGGFNVVLHGRNARKLERVREELRQEYSHVQTRAMVLDAMNFNMVDMQHEVEQISSLPLTVLVNNVGGVGPIMLDGELRPLRGVHACAAGRYDRSQRALHGSRDPFDTPEKGPESRRYLPQMDRTRRRPACSPR